MEPIQLLLSKVNTHFSERKKIWGEKYRETRDQVLDRRISQTGRTLHLMAHQGIQQASGHLSPENCFMLETMFIMTIWLKLRLYVLIRKDNSQDTHFNLKSY